MPPLMPPPQATAVGIIHWTCQRCLRRWTTNYEIRQGKGKEESLPMEHCCEECAGKTYYQINRLRKDNKKKAGEKC